MTEKHYITLYYNSVLEAVSAVCRVILKPVYQFGIPDSDHQTFKNFKINGKIFRASPLSPAGESLQLPPSPRYVEVLAPQKNSWIPHWLFMSIYVKLMIIMSCCKVRTFNNVAFDCFLHNVKVLAESLQ